MKMTRSLAKFFVLSIAINEVVCEGTACFRDLIKTAPNETAPCTNSAHVQTFLALFVHCFDQLVSSVYQAFTANPSPKDRGVEHLKITVDFSVTECRVAVTSANVDNKRALQLSNNDEHLGRRLEALELETKVKRIVAQNELIEMRKQQIHAENLFNELANKTNKNKK